MPELTFKCPTCEHKLYATLQDVGRIFDCPRCGNAVRVPEPDEVRRQQDLEAAEDRRSAMLESRVRSALAWPATPVERPGHLAGRRWNAQREFHSGVYSRGSCGPPALWLC